VGTRIEPLNGTYSGLVCIVQSLKGNMIWASPENNPKKPEYGYLAGEYKILPATFAPAAAIEESPEVKEHTAVAVIPQGSTAKPTTEAVTVVDDQWKEGDRVVVDADATDLPPSLQAYDGRQGVVTKVKESSAQCLVDFGGDEFMHIPFRGLRRG
jgi:ribosomal protein L21E